jgi:drug/metabolite transporter (DMT)-like permease
VPAVAGQIASWTPRAWTYLAYIVAVPTIVAYLSNAWALGRSTATLVTVYIYVQPLITAFLAWVQLGQHVTTKTAGAAVLIVIGVWIVATRPAAVPAPAQE